MAVSYNKLWKLLIDKNMKKKELGEAAGISNTLIAKLGKNENVTVEVLGNTCGAAWSIWWAAAAAPRPCTSSNWRRS